ncbi:MAG: hypothetical protein ABW101_09955 [Candidatus Thiodiazotropha sp.]
MKTTRKVLHLSMALAMTLPLVSAQAWSDETDVTDTPDETVVESPESPVSGTQQMFRNAGESDRLRHRVGENDNGEARRTRLESSAESSIGEDDSTVDGDPTVSSDQTPRQDRDRTRDQDQVQDESPDYDQIRQRDRDRLSAEDREDSGFEDPYQFGNRSAGQGFSTSGSMYRSMGANSRGSGGSSSAGMSQGGAQSGGHGSGNGNGRR